MYALYDLFYHDPFFAMAALFVGFIMLMLVIRSFNGWGGCR
jgi:hypothetical protein